ncbi:hypothetical protein [Komarekiella delphini-convector]|uniref:hypothetical protein n=1 Tax=Komarekiella delphini-convector TaxID=3050158 RepID=UPI00177FF324|nr:hypothetical protein [Komarekiella delphini-convector]
MDKYSVADTRGNWCLSSNGVDDLVTIANIEILLIVPKNFISISSSSGIVDEV